MVYNFIESVPVIIFMMLITIWVLFGDDIRQIIVDAENDDIFYWIIVACFILFTIEIVLTIYSK